MQVLFFITVLVTISQRNVQCYAIATPKHWLNSAVQEAWQGFKEGNVNLKVPENSDISLHKAANILILNVNHFYQYTSIS